jgi:antitoxin component YwqK of YwqJK toxin-antitoxin module
MRLFLFILTFTLLNFCFGQTNIWGVYVEKFGAYRVLDLKADLSYSYYSEGPCGIVPAYKDSGMYTVVGDTIFLQSNNISRKREKYLIITNETPKELYIGSPTICQIYRSETKLDLNSGGRISDYEGVYLNHFIKTQEYYDTGKINFKIDEYFKTKVITTYFPSGQVKTIEQYYKDRKSGDWYFYKYDGQIEKILTYRKGRLKRTYLNPF